jgi:hypothetical protein
MSGPVTDLTPLGPAEATIGPDPDRPGMAALTITRGPVGHRFTMRDSDLARVRAVIDGWLADRPHPDLCVGFGDLPDVPHFAAGNGADAGGCMCTCPLCCDEEGFCVCAPCTRPGTHAHRSGQSRRRVREAIAGIRDTPLLADAPPPPDRAVPCPICSGLGCALCGPWAERPPGYDPFTSP